MKTALMILMAAVLVGMTACTGTKTSKEDEAKAETKTEAEAVVATGPNTAVESSNLGAERVVYAAETERRWKSEKTKPGAEQWDSAPEGRSHVKFTYHGEKLTKIETFGEDGAPARILKAGVRIEWTYAAHGGVLDMTGYDDEGKVGRHAIKRYDDDGKLLEETFGYGKGEGRRVTARTEYTYGDDGNLTFSKTFDGEGKPLTEVTYHTGPDGKTRAIGYADY